ncbi:hypothetical protein DFJ58DRAFT_841904, partial [Suillus subalutaceus]|uniref:uncharacterized protein n=1 Tax=Suillus subalutaceus TaxID=48586 RepID=UPI001B885888
REYGDDGFLGTEWFERPMLLANKDNTATLQQPSETVTEVQLRALEVSGRGGVQTCSLAGAIFNNKDDKKGQQDTHRFYFERIKGILSTFPDTSNTRYQSYCEAAAELLTYLNEYITFLEQVRDKKEKQNFSHIEENLYNALHDGPTLTELAVLTLYAAAITHPYMRSVRGPGTENINILDLGPLHDEVMNHLELIIENPHLLISPNASFKLGALDGQEWQNPGAIEAVHKLAEEGKLPHLCEAFIAFCGGALGTWERFSIEFEAGVPSWHQQTMQMRQSAGLEVEQRADLVRHDQQEVAAKRWRRTERTEKRAEKGAAEDARLDGVAMVVMSKSEFLMLSNAVLTDQVNLCRRLDPLVPKRYTLKNKQALVSAIMESIARSTGSMSQTLE